MRVHSKGRRMLSNSVTGGYDEVMQHRYVRRKV